MTLIQYRNTVLNSINSNLGKIFLVVCLLIMAQGSFAADALSVAEEVVKDTYNGSIKTYLYVGEAVAAVVTLMMTRNIKALGGVGAVAIFLNIVASLAGI
ncbi:MAG: type IV conjugative transfer system pilin TraA [Legionella sp.]|jgi:hypothetical protein